MRLPELLAPAGSLEALHAAIAAGADAVYLGGRRFGARRFAANFDHADLAQAIDYAHLRGVRVYVTVNTLIREDELPDLGEYLLQLYELGADAILLQDLGAAALAGHLVAGLERHASTQMTIHNLPGALCAAQLGFKRVVLAREVNLEEIRAWGPEVERAGLGLEVFVHGALCYSYSGQCLLSSAIGGRSGNRGMCAQPCRKPYLLLHGPADEYGRPSSLQAVSGQESFILSTRDLSVYRHLDRIVSSPVHSLKIEGRMKSPQYVAIVTSIYRRALDAIASGTWSFSPEEERDLALAFNRDFTEGHLLGARDVMGREMPDNRGVLMGRVAWYDPRRSEAGIRLCSPLLPQRGDGLVFRSPGQERGLTVQRAVERDGLLCLRTGYEVPAGAEVYLTSSTALARRAEEILAQERPPIQVDITLTWEDGYVLAQGQLDNGLMAAARGESRMQKALNRPLTPEQIETQMRRTGGTPFVIRRVNMDYPGGLFSPLGALNQLRRDLLAGLERAVLEGRRPAPEQIQGARDRLQSFSPPTSRVKGRRRPPLLSVCADSLEALKGAVEGGASRIYFDPLFRTGHDAIERAERIRALLQEGRELCGRTELIWKWPHITRDDFIDTVLPLLPSVPVEGIMVENLGPAWAVRQKMPEMMLYGGLGLNVCNHLTVQALASQFSSLTLSPELSCLQLKDAVFATRALPGQDDLPALELVVQGNLEVMVAEDSIPHIPPGGDLGEFWGLQDSRHIFPARLDDQGRTHIFNSMETCLIDQMPEIFRIGLDGIILDARGRTGRYAQEVTAAYRRAVELTAGRYADNSIRRDSPQRDSPESGSLEAGLQELKERIRPLSLGGITHGHFLRGLKD